MRNDFAVLILSHGRADRVYTIPTLRMKNNIDDINGWLYHRIRMCIWKQWKKPRTKVRNLIKMGVPEALAMQAGNTRRGH